jgi:hypothetical protein
MSEELMMRLLRKVFKRVIFPAVAVVRGGKVERSGKTYAGWDLRHVPVLENWTGKI